VQSSRLRSLILSVVSLGIVSAFVYYLYLNADRFSELLQVSFAGILALLLLTLATMLINGFINVAMFWGLGVKISHRDGFVLAAASTFANQLPISGGMIARGVYLKNKHNLSYAKFISASLAIFVCFIAVNGFIGLVILLYRMAFAGNPVSPFLLLGFGAMAACIIVFWIPLDFFRVPERFRNRITQAVDGWMFVGKYPALVLNLVGLQTASMILLAARYYVAFHMLSQNVSMSDVALFSSAAVLTQLVSIAPGGLGVTESIVAAVASALGFDMGVSVVAVGLDRLVSTIAILIVGGIDTVILGKQLADIPEKTGKPD